MNTSEKIKLWQPLAPQSIFDIPEVADGNLQADTEFGKITIGLVAEIPVEGQQQITPHENAGGSLVPGEFVPIAIQPENPYVSEIGPFAYLDPGTNFGIKITVPTALIDQKWSYHLVDKQRDEWQERQQIAVQKEHRVRHSASVAIRTNDGVPVASTVSLANDGTLIYDEFLLHPAVGQGDTTTFIIKKRAPLASTLEDRARLPGFDRAQLFIPEQLTFGGSDSGITESVGDRQSAVEIVLFDVLQGQTIIKRKPVGPVIHSDSGRRRGIIGVPPGLEGYIGQGTDITAVDTIQITNTTPFIGFKLALISTDTSKGRMMTVNPASRAHRAAA